MVKQIQWIILADMSMMIDYVQETFADIPDEFCDEDDSSVIGESIIQVILFNVLFNE